MAFIHPGTVLILNFLIFAVTSSQPLRPPPPKAFSGKTLDALHQLLSDREGQRQRKLKAVEFSSQVAVVVNDQLLACLAVLVEVDGQQIGITSANCVEPAGDHQMGLLAIDPSANDGDLRNFQFRQVVRAVIHEDFDFLNSATPTNNIAILFIEEPFEVNDYVQTTSLPSEGPQGVLTAIGRFPDDPMDQIIQLEVLSDETCEEAWDNHPFEFLSGEMMCAAENDEWVTAACEYDGVHSKNGNGELAGFLGNGYLTCQPGLFPPTYINVFHFVTWINDKVAASKKMGD